MKETELFTLQEDGKTILIRDDLIDYSLLNPKYTKLRGMFFDCIQSKSHEMFITHIGRGDMNMGGRVSMPYNTLATLINALMTQVELMHRKEIDEYRSTARARSSNDQETSGTKAGIDSIRHGDDDGVPA